MSEPHEIRPSPVYINIHEAHRQLSTITQLMDWTSLGIVKHGTNPEPRIQDLAHAYGLLSMLRKLIDHVSHFGDCWVVNSKNSDNARL